MNRSFMATRESALAGREWVLFDAEGQVLGRLATRIASILRGKHKPTFTPNQDAGDFVVVINAAKLRLTGNKLEDKAYYRHSGYPGGLRTTSARVQMETRPEKVLQDAVVGMLPKNRLGRQLATKVKIYRDENHPHAAQMPKVMTLEGSKA